MRLLFIILLIGIAGFSHGKAFDMEKCVDSCGGDQECVDRCAPYEAPAAEAPQIENKTSNESGGPGDTVETAGEEDGICGPAIILAGLAGLVIKNAEREI